MAPWWEHPEEEGPVTEMLCKDCDAMALFVVPECEDGQDEGDRMCVVCGAAISLGGMLLAEVAPTAEDAAPARDTSAA